jgi:predicted permease
MIGIIFKINLNKEDVKIVASILYLRYIAAIIFALIILFLLPMPIVDKQVLAVIIFAPITSVSSIYCGECGCDVSIVGVLNSLSIAFSIVFFIIMLLVLHI